MAENEQYLTEKHYLVCDKGMKPKKVKVTSHSTVKIGGHLAATSKDTQKSNTFMCVGKYAFLAGAAAGVASMAAPAIAAACACIPGPGWVVAAIIAVAIAAVLASGYFICKSAASQRKWTETLEVDMVKGKALTLNSIMVCPKEGGTITPKETFWSAWGSAALTNLGHISQFAFGFLAGRGMASMAMGATSAAGGVSSLATKQGATTFAKEFGKQFLNTARKELAEQFTFKGFKNAGNFCKIMRGLGVGGAYYDQYSIWSSDKSLGDKAKDSILGLVMSIFAAKGATTVCFPAGTLVHTENGLANIEELKVGDKVLTFNESTKKKEYKPILIIHQRYTMQMCGLELVGGEMLQVTPEHRFYSNGEWVEARELQPGDLLHNKDGDYVTILGIDNFPHYEKVYNFDVQDNENYYVTEEGILVHNGYGPKDGDLLEGDIAKALDDADIPYIQGEKFGPNGSIGEIDFQLDNFHIEATVQNGGKLKQIVKHMSNEVLNPNGKPVILIGPNYKNLAAVKAIEDAGATVVHSIEDLISIIK
ncbi:Hint domain-containing protein [Apibacter sp. HY039]|uniref:Hint domain-containing protein n=1 Tax=Apibacter sp. HY039 TaxID=2501476 RepID=UPI000FEB8667|nr:Hint domain-containing protein [Apibacter sp. HY039]